MTEESHRRAIENGFPTGFVSLLATRESWRKEVNRPIYYLHKWWARRLGSVFRAILIGASEPAHSDIEGHFHSPTRSDLTVFDPFMGSGVTVGEAAKLGMRVIGRDINPVAAFACRTALEEVDRVEVERAFAGLEHSVGKTLRDLYIDCHGEVLYYFWVMVLPCPECGQDVSLFSRRIFARNAYPTKRPEAQSVCPGCGGIHEVRFDATVVECPHCELEYRPQESTVVRSTATCPKCHSSWKVIEGVRAHGDRPRYRMYAKLVLTGSGEKVYLKTGDEDERRYREAADALRGASEWIPNDDIRSGHNTRQVLNYGFLKWRHLFNERQLLAFGMLCRAVSEIGDQRVHALFASLLSGTLEFNNLLASYKGEGTGAVRHAFAHHILKPELQPIEANVWGTPKSSGAFSTLYRSRLIRALDYKERPFELSLGADRGAKVYGLSDPVEYSVSANFAEFDSGDARVYISTGDSSETDLPDASVDLVVTDPPFFDNVHYSELADFFYVWLKLLRPIGLSVDKSSTRSEREVQNTDPHEFGSRLQAVFLECARVLKPDGLLAFTYHHSRPEGWESMYRALRSAGFKITRVHPVKAEMAVSVPVMQAREPINYDLIIVCRHSDASHSLSTDEAALAAVSDVAATEIRSLTDAALPLSSGDIRVIAVGALLSALRDTGSIEDEVDQLRRLSTNAIQTVLEAVSSRDDPDIP